VTLRKLKPLSIALGIVGLLILSGCHKKITPPVAPLAPPPLHRPTATISATPNAIRQGQTLILAWKTTDASEATISGVGTVATSGSQTLSPTSSTSYTITAKGPGGTVEASTRVTVEIAPTPRALPPSMTEEELFAQGVQDVYFNYDKFDLRPNDSSIVQQDASFLEKYKDMKVVIEGHCDDRGSAEYNIALGQNRAESLQKALVADGVAANRIRVISYGKEKPFCTAENEECWQQNRHDHLKLDH
jgi:peptidoglycan-associated lipoprotein